MAVSSVRITVDRFAACSVHTVAHITPIRVFFPDAASASGLGVSMCSVALAVFELHLACNGLIQK
jgi:hypothetical protein